MGDQSEEGEEFSEDKGFREGKDLESGGLSGRGGVADVGWSLREEAWPGEDVGPQMKVAGRGGGASQEGLALRRSGASQEGLALRRGGVSGDGLGLEKRQGLMSLAWEEAGPQRAWS